MSGGGRSLTLAEVAKSAIELGGKYDGHELPDNINKVTIASATALAGQGLMGVARDTYPRDGASFSFVAGFAEVEVDVETGKYHIIDYARGRRRRHDHPPARARWPGARAIDARHRATRSAEEGLRPALRGAAREAVLPEPSADDSRRAAEHEMGGA